MSDRKKSSETVELSIVGDPPQVGSDHEQRPPITDIDVFLRKTLEGREIVEHQHALRFLGDFIEDRVVNNIVSRHDEETLIGDLEKYIQANAIDLDLRAALEIDADDKPEKTKMLVVADRLRFGAQELMSFANHLMKSPQFYFGEKVKVERKLPNEEGEAVRESGWTIEGTTANGMMLVVSPDKLIQKLVTLDELEEWSEI